MTSTIAVETDRSILEPQGTEMTNERSQKNAAPQCRREFLAAAALTPLAVARGSSTNGAVERSSKSSGPSSVATILRKHVLAGLSEMELSDPYLATAMASARLEKELSLIEQLGLSHNLLTAYDLVHRHGEPGFLALGREVEHCSLAAYVLEIVHVSPISQELSYEDFAYEVSQKRRISLDVCSLRWDELVRDDPKSLETLRIVPSLCLTVIHRIHALIRESRRGKLFGLQIPLDDSPTYQMLSRGNTEGIPFLDQPESQQALCRLRPEWFYELVAFFAVEYAWFDSPALWEFIAAKHDRVRAAWPSPIVKALKSTYGQVLYREQAFRIIQELLFCDYDSAARVWSELTDGANTNCFATRDALARALKRAGMDDLSTANLLSQFDRVNCESGSRALGVYAAFSDYTLAYLKAHYPAEFSVAWRESRAEGGVG